MSELSVASCALFVTGLGEWTPCDCAGTGMCVSAMPTAEVRKNDRVTLSDSGFGLVKTPHCQNGKKAKVWK